MLAPGKPRSEVSTSHRHDRALCRSTSRAMPTNSGLTMPAEAPARPSIRARTRPTCGSCRGAARRRAQPMRAAEPRRTRVRMNEVKDKIWFLREGLFAKYVVALVGLVVFVLAGQRCDGDLDHLWRHQAARWPTACARRRRRPPSASSSRSSDLGAADLLGDRAASSTQRPSAAPTTRNCRGRCRRSASSRCSAAQGREQLRHDSRRPSRSAATPISPATSASPRPSGARHQLLAPAYLRDQQPYMSITLSHAGRQHHGRRDRPRLPSDFLDRRPGRQGGVSPMSIDPRGAVCCQFDQGPPRSARPSRAAAGRRRQFGRRCADVTARPSAVTRC